MSEITIVERFTSKIIGIYNAISLTDTVISQHEKYLIKNYFIEIDKVLKKSESKRVLTGQWANLVSYKWENVNLDDLANSLVRCAKLGLDMTQENTLWAIPFLNKKTSKYDINLMKGYNGIRFLAENYAKDKILATQIELVYSTDIFKPLKKSINNNIESYEFEIINPFERGEVIGAFGYIEYEDPRKNKLTFMSKKDLDKRKSLAKSDEFWSKWTHEMYIKVIIKATFNPRNVPLYPNDDLQFLETKESEFISCEVQEAATLEIQEKANTGEVIDFYEDEEAGF